MLTCAQAFVDKLAKEGLQYATGNTEKGDTVVDFPYQGKNLRCLFSGELGEYVSFYIVYEHVPQEKVGKLLCLCNKLKSEYQWVSFYLDSDDDLVLHCDAIVTPETANEICFELLVRTLKISEDIKPEVMKSLCS